MAKLASQLASTAPRGSLPNGPHEPAKPMTGPERAAVLLLALGEDHGAKVWAQLDDYVLRQLVVAMSTLGTVEASTVETMMVEFITKLSHSGAVMGNYDATERLLRQFIPAERVANIIDEIRGPAG